MGWLNKYSGTTTTDTTIPNRFVNKKSKTENKKGLGFSDEDLLKQAWKESSFRPKVKNSLGYMGLAQVGDEAIHDYKKAHNLKTFDPYDPTSAKKIQRWYMDKAYNSGLVTNPTQTEENRKLKALAYYNYGPGNLRKVLREAKSKNIDTYKSDKWLDLLPQETREYGNKILGKDEKFNREFDSVRALPKYNKIVETYVPKAQDGRKERNASLKVRDNIPQQNKFQFKPRSQRLIDSINKQEQIEKTGELKQYEPQSTFNRIKEVALNPVTAFGYAARNQVLPENFSRGERNPVDYAVDVINPAQYVEDTKNVVEGVYKGDLSQVGQGALGVLPLGLEAKNLYRGIKGGAKELAEFVPKKLSKNKLDSSTPKINKTIIPENISVKDTNVDKMKEVISNTPSFYKDGVKLIDELELSKITDDYLENTLSAESMAMRKKLDKEWGSTLYRDALEYERQYDNYRTIGGNKSVKLMPDERYEEVLEKMKKRGFKDFQGLSSPDKRNIVFEEGFPGYISRNEITRNGAERGKEFIKTVMDHEVAHGLNFNGKSIGPKLSKEIKGFFKDDIMDLANEKSTIDGLSSLENQRAYIQNPTETISFLVTNLKTELKNLKIIPDYNSTIKYSDLKNSKTWKRFSKYVKTEKVNELLDFINKMPRSVVPGAIGTAAASQATNSFQENKQFKNGGKVKKKWLNKYQDGGKIIEDTKNQTNKEAYNWEEIRKTRPSFSADFMEDGEDDFQKNNRKLARESVDNSSVNYLNSYYNSDVFKERFKINNSDAFTKYGYDNNSERKEYAPIIKKSVDEAYKKYQPYVLEEDPNYIGSRVTNNRFNPIFGAPVNTTMLLSKPQARRLNSDLFNEILPHEYTHSARDLTKEDEFMLSMYSFDKNMPEYRKEYDQYLKDNNQDSFAEIFPYGKNTSFSSFLKDDNIPKKNRKENLHNSAPNEIHADLDSLRYNLFKEGIYDTRKGDMSDEQYEEMISNSKIRNNFMFKRLKKHYPDKHSFLKIMNTIAQNKQNNYKKNYAKHGKIIEDNRGQWAHPGEVTKINSNNITMKGVNYPVLGISDTGDTQMMYPNGEYQYDGKSVTEYPMAQDGKKLVVNSKDDPRYKAYQDSLALYDYSKLQKSFEPERNKAYAALAGTFNRLTNNMDLSNEQKKQQDILNKKADEIVANSENIKYGLSDRHNQDGSFSRSKDIYSPNIEYERLYFNNLNLTNADYSNVRPKQEVVVAKDNLLKEIILWEESDKSKVNKEALNEAADKFFGLTPVKYNHVDTKIGDVTPDEAGYNPKIRGKVKTKLLAKGKMVKMVKDGANSYFVFKAPDGTLTNYPVTKGAIIDKGGYYLYSDQPPREKIKAVELNNRGLNTSQSKPESKFAGLEPEIAYWDVVEEVNQNFGGNKRTKKVYRQDEIDRIKRKQAADENSFTGKNNKISIKPRITGWLEKYNK